MESTTFSLDDGNVTLLFKELLYKEDRAEIVLSYALRCALKFAEMDENEDLMDTIMSIKVAFEL